MPRDGPRTFPLIYRLDIGVLYELLEGIRNEIETENKEIVVRSGGFSAQR